MLDRSDLPDDRTALDTFVEVPGWERRPLVRETASGAAARRRLTLVLSAISAALLSVALVLGVWLATSTTERTAGTIAAILAGVPAALLASSLIVALIGRRRRR
jgi:hypothetical protein